MVKKITNKLLDISCFDKFGEDRKKLLDLLAGDVHIDNLFGYAICCQLSMFIASVITSVSCRSTRNW